MSPARKEGHGPPERSGPVASDQLLSGHLHGWTEACEIRPLRFTRKGPPSSLHWALAKEGEEPAELHRATPVHQAP